MTAFAPIHNHSEYSSLDGLSTCREIAERCQKIGCNCCGISDHGTVAGHLEFDRVMRAHDIKPIFACELYHGVKTEFGKQERDQAHFVAGALNDGGLRNLWRLVDYSSRPERFRFVGRVNWDLLGRFNEGVFATSACIQGLVSQAVLKEDSLTHLDRYLEIFGDNFYIELHTYPTDDQERLNLELVQIARMKGVPLIYATDAHFASPGQYEVHDAFVAMQTGENIYMDVEDRKMWHPKALYIQSEGEIRESLSYLPEGAVDEALANSHDLAQKASASLPGVRRHLPVFIPSESPWTEAALGRSFEGPSAAALMLVNLVELGIADRYGDHEEAWNRATTELEVFLEADLEHYFLQVWDFCEFCNRNAIRRGPGRGSAAGSIVAYALGITDVDPLHYGLIFERFYNPGRAKGYPDIDTDFPKAQRKRVKEYLIARWGENKVRAIGTITRLKPKAACDRTYSACSVTWDEKEALKKIIDHVPDIDILGPDSIGWSSDVDPGKSIYVEDHVSGEINRWIGEQPADRREYLENWRIMLKVICSRVSGYGVHPSGIVVSDVDLQDELPCNLRGSSKERVQATCFPMSEVDLRQFLKDDLLGLRTLDTIEEWERLYGAVEWSGLDKQQHPDDMWKLLEDGFTLGAFQIEAGYAKHLVKEFKPRSVEDLGIIVALNRPGPIRSGAPESFIRRRRGDEPITYDHPILEDVLHETYGWFLYQEQVIRFFGKLGYTLSEADAVRKILGKKKPEEMRAVAHGEGEWKGRSFFDMAKASGVNGRVAEVIWRKLEEFAKYSFNKSHAIAYAIIAFRTLYMKYYGPQEFIIASIRTLGDDPDKATKTAGYIAEGRRREVVVHPPDVRRSDVDMMVIDGEVLFGFSNVKGIGKATARQIINIREQYELYSPEALDAALEIEHEQWEARRDHAKENGLPFKERSPRQVVRSNQIVALYKAGGWDLYDEGRPLIERQRYQKELLGAIITDQCVEIFDRNRDAVDQCDSYGTLDYLDSGDRIMLAGAVSQIVPKTTRREGKAMGIVTIEFEGDEAEFVVFPKQWASYKFLWKDRVAGVFTLKNSDRGLSFDNGLKLQ